MSLQVPCASRAEFIVCHGTAPLVTPTEVFSQNPAVIEITTLPQGYVKTFVQNSCQINTEEVLIFM